MVLAHIRIIFNVYLDAAFSSMQVYIFHTHPKAGFKTVHIIYVCNIEFETWRTRISPYYSPKGVSFPVLYHMNE